MCQLTNKDLAGRELLIELHYLPNLDYMCCLMQFESVRIEAAEQFVKQTSRNRTRILTANKVDVLTVPVKSAGAKLPVREIEIDYTQDWIRRHWGAIQSAYGKSPYFEFYRDDFEQVFRSRPRFLFELNQQLLTLCLEKCRIQTSVQYNLTYTKSCSEKIFDSRGLVNDKKNTDNPAFYRSIAYYQTFGHDFVPNLSIVDLLFNAGPEALGVLKRSALTWEDSVTLNKPDTLFVS